VKIGLALICAVSVTFAGPAWGADSDQFRPYLYLGIGGAYFSNAGSDSDLPLDNPSQYPFAQAAIGANFDRHWGAEIAINYVETSLDKGGAGRGSKGLGEYSLWGVLGQARLRYPLFDDRLVPYLVGGAGIGIGEFNDRADFTTDFAGSQDTSFIASAGVGAEYFVSPNIAIGVEAKHIFLFNTDVSLMGENRELDLDNTMVMAGMRLYFDRLADGDAPNGRAAPPAADRDGLRGYVIARTGAAFLTDPDSSGQVEIDSPTRIDFGVGVGVNLNRNWGAEIVGDYFEPGLTAPGLGEVGEYAVYTYLAHLRYRYPIWHDRVVPYVVAGGGLGVMEVNDRRQPFASYPLNHDAETAVIGSVGAGLEYFLEDNIAVDVEARHLFGLERDLQIGNTTSTLDTDTVLVTAGLRILFP